MPIKRVVNRNDGHIYYVIESDGQTKTYVGVFFVENYDQLVDHEGEWGLWFVRDAAADDTGQHGDPTVHEGWAMYAWDTQKRVTKDDGSVVFGGWRKVAEQESVDGPWGIDERILAQLVKKVDFNLAIESLKTRVSTLEVKAEELEAAINAINVVLAELQNAKHSHDNKDTLDDLSTENDKLKFRDTPVAGYNYLYATRIDGCLAWRDPADKGTAAEPIDNSMEVAKKFATTSAAYVGMTLSVLENDGSITEFRMLEDNEHRGPYRAITSKKFITDSPDGRKFYQREEDGGYTELTASEAATCFDDPTNELFYTDYAVAPVFVDTNIQEAFGGAIFVSSLPTASTAYDNKGVWYPTDDDGDYEPNKFYRSVNGQWVALGEDAQQTETVEGAKFISARILDDVEMPFKRFEFYWQEPTDSTENKVFWKKTTLVRKHGSAPESIDDGIVVHVTNTSDNGINHFVEVCEYDNDKVYYRLFSNSRSGGAYKTTDAVSPEYTTWADIFNALNQEGMIDKFVNVGDIITLPKHPVYGQIDCRVIDVTALGIERSIRVATKFALEKKAFGSSNDYDTSDLKKWLDVNFNMYTQFDVLTDSDWIAQEGVTYYAFDTKKGFYELEVEVGKELPEGTVVYIKSTDYPNGIVKGYEIPSASSVGFENICKVKHLVNKTATIDWWTTDKIGDKVATGNDQTTGSDPTAELGAVVVFTIKQ